MSSEGNDERSADEIRADIESRRKTIASAVERIDQRIHRTLDWRQHVARHPAAFVGAATGLGIATAWMLRRPRRGSLDRIADALTDTLEDLRDRVGDGIGDLADSIRGTQRRTSRSAGGPTARAAVAAAIAKAAADFVKEKLRDGGARVVAHQAEREAARRNDPKPIVSEQIRGRRDYGDEQGL